MRVAEFLVKWRRLFLALTMALAVVCGVCLPRLNVIYEMSYFLPDDSPVKKGLVRVEQEFPGLDLQNNMLYVMFENLEDPGQTERELSAFTTGMALLDTRESGSYTLFQYLPVAGADVRAVKAAIVEHWGDEVTVELDLDKNMPADIVPMITLGAILVLIVLLVMCQSFMEVFLFLLSMLIAVLINMGSCILMNGVSYMTVTIAGVLQMILSMDYSIILTNRYRQEKLRAAGNDQAMARAIHGSSQTIFSSALTTVVSLLMLMFMKVKIGPDLGFVLSKGVICSLLCNFTVLPSFILAFDKAITATSKKIPTLPFGALARLQIRLKIPLTILFVGIFVTACILQNRTEVSFSAVWETPISKIFPPQNPVVLLYDNVDEKAVPGIMDTLDRDPSVLSTLSYPALMLSGYTASEMAQRYGNLSPMVNEEILRLIYYAHAHPERNERLSFAQMENVVNRISSKGLLPAGYDMDSMLKDLMPSAPAPKPKAAKQHPAKQKQAAEPKPQVPSAPAVPDTLSAAAKADSTAVDSLAIAAPLDSAALAQKADSTAVSGEAPIKESSVPSYLEGYPEITYELATRQMTSREMAELLGVERSLVNTGYRMAGRTRKPATMSPHEMRSFIVNKILTDKRYASFIPADQAEQIREVHRLLDSAFIAGPSPAQLADAPLLASADSTVAAAPVDSVAVAALVPTPVQETIEDVEEDLPPTPMERLAMMYMSGNRYSAGQIYSALKAAGVKVNRSDIDLLFLYAGCMYNYDRNLRMSPGGMIEFLYDKILPDPMFASFIDEESRESLDSMSDLLGGGINALRGKNCSVAMALTSYDYESPATFEFLERFQTLADRSLTNPGTIMGESVIYKEFKDDFPNELLLLTLLTVGAIFLIVLLTFQSFVIPILLIITVMSGVYVNVFVSGLGGHTMFFMAYLIVQSILMGATIDYSILLTSYYREERMVKGIVKSLADSFHRAGHSILTSGLILTLAPYAMSLMIDDKIVKFILKPLAVGALVASLMVLLMLPGGIAVCDRFIAPKGAKRSNKSYSQK
jgi:predicted RND superfamily exporter protein